MFLQRVIPKRNKISPKRCASRKQNYNFEGTLLSIQTLICISATVGAYTEGPSFRGQHESQ